MRRTTSAPLPITHPLLLPPPTFFPPVRLPTERRPHRSPAGGRVFERAGARVVVDESSLQLLLGATVDYEEEMMKSAFVIKDNPIAEASCGCGTSFQVNI